MKVYLTILSCICLISLSAQRIVKPTSDVSINFGVAITNQTIDVFNSYDVKPLLANLNFTSNQPYGRHIFEIGAIFKEEAVISDLSLNYLQGGLNYSYNHQVFAYYPSCQIANQVYAGLRFNAEAYTNDVTQLTSFFDKDLFEYSLALSIGTDYNFDDRNYLTFQFYLPFLNKVQMPIQESESGFAGGSDVSFEDRQYDSEYFTGGDLNFFNDFNKFGAVLTYRIMFSDVAGVLLKYHFQNINYTSDKEATFQNKYELNQHQLSLGVILHREG